MRNLGGKTMLWGIATLAACPLPALCDEGVLEPHGPVGMAERLILMDATAIMLAVVIPVIVLALGLRGGFAPETRKRVTCLTGNIRAA